MSPTPYSRFPSRYWPLSLVLFCGFTLAYLVVRTYVAPLPRQYQLDFGRAQWIEPPQFSSVAYFRKKAFLSVAPSQAWIQIAATDNFTLTINGRKVAQEHFLKTRVAGIYDIKTRLTPGTNVIGIEINRLSFPGSAQLLVSGVIKQPGQNPIMLASDASWRVTIDTGIVQGSEPWNSVLVQDETWPQPRPVNVQNPTINWVSTNPLLLRLPPSGKWLIAKDAPRQAIFSSTLEARRPGQETWIQVASSGDLDLLVNGKLITGVPIAPLEQGGLPRLVRSTVMPNRTSEQEPSSDASTSNAAVPEPLSMDAYDISQWIHRGSNQIIAAVRSSQQPATFIAEGFTVLRNGYAQPFQTNSSWQVLGLSSEGQTSESKHAIETGDNGVAPYGYLREGYVKQPRLADFDTIAKVCAFTLGTVLLVIAAWVVASWAAAVCRNQEFRGALVRDALLHVPVTVAMLFGILLTYDYRFPNDLVFHPIFCFGALAALGAVRFLHLLYFSQGKRKSSSLALKDALSRYRGALPYLLLAGIMVFGWVLRYHNLAYVSFDHDEMGLITKSKGVFIRGYPYYEYPGGEIRPSTTYELVPYVLAVFGRIFGYSEWSMRLPSCIWGTLTIPVIALFGRRLFNWQAGLVTALIYACMTVDIRWAQNAFYVQQSQFFSMITFWCFYEAVSFRPLNHKYLTATSVAFCLAFLSWEGNGFTLPALFAGLVIVRWGQWWWLKDWHLYRCLFAIAALVIAQFCSRTLLASAPYLSVGSGLSNIAGPSLFFLSFAYQPFYYVNKLLLDENHVLFTLMIALGLPFCWRNAGYRYIIALLAVLVVLYTNFLAAVSQRYCYFFQPLVLLGGIGAASLLYDRFLAIASYKQTSFLPRAMAHVSGIAILFLLFIQSNESLVKVYSLSAEGDAPGLMSRMNIYRYDYRRAARYVRDHFQPGDVIIPIISHVFENYAGMRSDYYIDTLLAKKVTYNNALAEPVLIEKFRGNPALRNLNELRDAIHRSRRTWVVLAPWTSMAKIAGPDVTDYLNQNGKAVFETYRAKVYLIQGANQPDVAQSVPLP